MEERPTVLYLVRHGETPANVRGIMNGWLEEPLTARGRRQARAAAAFLAGLGASFRALYASPLRRTWETAHIVGEALGLEPRPEPGLKEYHVGRYTGYPMDRIPWSRHPDEAPHGGETPRQFTIRVMAALERIVRAHPGEAVVVVTHNGPISVAAAILVAGDGMAWPRYQLPNAGVARLTVRPAGEGRLAAAGPWEVLWTDAGAGATGGSS